MASPEARVNAALARLCEEFRLGMIAMEEFHSRRRQLFESWSDDDITTSPGTLGHRSRKIEAEPSDASPAQAESGGGGRWIAVAALLVIIGGAAAAVYLLTGGPRDAGSPPAGSATPAAAMPAEPAVRATPPRVQEIKARADAFLKSNTWDEMTIGEFLAAWRRLSIEDQALAMREPSLRSLKFELQQTIQALEAINRDEGSREQDQLMHLYEFADELDAG